CTDLFVSSRGRHTRSKRDWSSDVCSSDLLLAEQLGLGIGADLAAFILPVAGGTAKHVIGVVPKLQVAHIQLLAQLNDRAVSVGRSEERRVGKEGRPQWRRWRSAQIRTAQH